ncbi:c-type cytochrome [Profundibacter sp.]|uniref:c-type cytochrome n=1 Tax=Profundibacter sp. TaxID=3101071 RepID=UPI003D144FDD
MRSLLLFLILATTASAAEVSSPRATELRHLVEQDCGACHGMTRKGGLGPDIRAQTLEGRDAEGLAQIIKDGIPDTAMPPWGPLLADQDINWIAQYLLEDTEE